VYKWQEVQEVHKAPLPLVYPLGTQPQGTSLADMESPARKDRGFAHFRGQKPVEIR
jgi:hypothetical protein